MMVELNELKGRSLAAVTRALNRKNLQITAQENRLAGLNPKSVLNRGYSITLNKQHRPGGPNGRRRTGRAICSSRSWPARTGSRARSQELMKDDG